MYPAVKAMVGLKCTMQICDGLVDCGVGSIHSAAMARKARQAVKGARLRSSRSYVIGMLVCEITNPFYAELVAGVGATLESAGHVALLANTEESPARCLPFPRIV